MIVYLIGYRGTGKSTIARLLAEKLAWHYCDADQVLEERYGRSIRQIFAEAGESDFRDKETAVLEELAKLDKHVVSTGGGVILRPQNRALLRAGKVVWLKAPADILWHRIQEDSATNERRPNLAQGGLAEIEALLRERAPFYEACADLQVDTSEQSPAQAADQIHTWLVSAGA